MVEQETKKIKTKGAKARKIALPRLSFVSVLRKPHITEKSSLANEFNQYVFKVSPGANKILIKREIEDLYKVNVQKVMIVNVRPKKRNLGQSKGYKKGYKKAIVKIKKGQKIEILPK